MSIGVAFTVMDENVQEMFDTLLMADGLGADIINFQPVVNDNTDFTSREQSPFWISPARIPILESEIKKIRQYRPKHITISEEPQLELLVKYYQGKLSSRDWRCFGGFKTMFVCFSKRQPLLYSCHGVCGNLNEVSLRQAWTSKEARRLRAHSRNCKTFCMQSCYSQASAQNLYNVIRTSIMN